MRHLPFSNIDLLDSPPLAFPHREALYEDVRGIGCRSQLETGREGEFASTPDPKSPDKAIEVGDQIYATTLRLPLTKDEIRASQTTSQ